MTSTPTKPVDNVVIATKGLQDRNINIIAGTTVENKGKLILIDYSRLMVRTKKFFIMNILHSSILSLLGPNTHLWRKEF